MRIQVGRGGPFEWRRWTGPRTASPRWRGAAAVVAGALPALAFPAPSLWWFGYVALVPWMLLVRSAPTGRRAALDGWLGGLGFMVAVHHWLIPSLHVFIVVLAGLLGLLWAPWGWLVRATLGGAPSAGRAAAACAVVPSGWLAVELARSWEGLGGPWGLLGAGQWEVPPALRLASVGGVWLVSLLVVAVNTALTLALAPGPGPGSVASVAPIAGARTAGARTAGVRVAAGVALAVCAAVTASGWVWAPRPEASGTARIAVVQAGVVSGPGAAGRRFARGEALTRGLAGRDLDLVVWGESSVGFDLTARRDLAARIAALSRTVGADILVNVDARSTDPAGRGGIFKRTVLVGPGGPTGDTYDKMRLVPFGEYVPARAALGWATSVGKAAGEDRVRGSRQRVLALPGASGLRFGPLICFETAFPDMSGHLVADGAQVLVGQSSTSSFQGSWAPGQHASLAALRAAETGRPMVHATLTGISAVFGPTGARVGEAGTRTGTGTRTGIGMGTDSGGAAVYDVPLARGTTPYVRYGDWAVHGALAVLALFCAARLYRSLRRPAPAPRVPRARTAHASAERPARRASARP